MYRNSPQRLMPLQWLNVSGSVVNPNWDPVRQSDGCIQAWKKKMCWTNSLTPKRINWVLKLKTQRFKLWVIWSIWLSRNIVLFIEVIKGRFHTSVLYTIHFRHKEMKVNFYIHFKSRILGYLLSSFKKQNLVSSLECKLSGTGLVGPGHLESRALSSLCSDLCSYTC